MKQQKYIRYILLPTTLLCLIASLFLWLLCQFRKISKTGFYFDTMITVTLYGTRDEKILDDCFSLAGNYEKKLSNTITDSEVSKINEANGQFVTVSSDTSPKSMGPGLNRTLTAHGRTKICPRKRLA